MSSPLETYLNTVHSCLWVLPKQQRADELRELRQHLAALTVSERETDVQAALERFGPPQVVGRQIVRAWCRGRLVSIAASPVGATLLAGLLIPLPAVLVRVVMPPEIISSNIIIIHGFPLPLSILWQMGIGMFVGRRLQRSPALLIAVLMSASVLAFLLPFAQVIVEHLIATGAFPVFSDNSAVVRIYAQAALLNLAPSALLLLPAAFAGRAWSKRLSA